MNDGRPTELTTLPVPATLDQALDPAWLTDALAPVAGGAPVAAVEVREVIRTVATKVRFAAAFDDGRRGDFCLKGLLDVDEATARGGSTMVLEGDFYLHVAAEVDVRVPACVASVVDRAKPGGVVIMRDLIQAGARFCSALEAFSPDQAAASLDQIARLHAGRGLLDRFGWIRPRAAELAQAQYVPEPMLQQLLDGPRGDRLPAAVRDARRLITGLKALAARDAGRPQTVIHGDAHAGNIFETAEGPGLIDWQLLQRGSWALDVAYHLCAVLDVAEAEREERRLLGHYLQTARGLGLDPPDPDAAWAAYREAVVYGYYLWGITRRVEPAIIEVFTERLGSAVARHGSFERLGV